MSEANSDPQLDVLRKVAQFQAQAAAESRSKLIDDHSSAFRWMIASLFALNGGAILSILGSDRFELQSNLPTFWIFFAGIIATFLAVIFSQTADNSMIANKHNWGLYWVTVEATNEQNEELEMKLKTAIKAAERFGLWGRVQAFFAMLFFVMGVLAAVVLEQKAEIAHLQAQIDGNAQRLDDR